MHDVHKPRCTPNGRITHKEDNCLKLGRYSRHARAESGMLIHRLWPPPYAVAQHHSSISTIPLVRLQKMIAIVWGRSQATYLSIGCWLPEFTARVGLAYPRGPHTVSMHRACAALREATRLRVPVHSSPNRNLKHTYPTTSG